jgi:hypothetical protein
VFLSKAGAKIETYFLIPKYLVKFFISFLLMSSGTAFHDFPEKKPPRLTPGGFL